MIDKNSKPMANPNIAGRVVAGEAILVHPEKGNVRVLNEVGALIWELSDSTHTVSDIVIEICQRFQIDQKSAEEDTIEFLNDLIVKEIIFI